MARTKTQACAALAPASQSSSATTYRALHANTRGSARLVDVSKVPEMRGAARRGLIIRSRLARARSSPATEPHSCTLACGCHGTRKPACTLREAPRS